MQVLNEMSGGYFWVCAHGSKYSDPSQEDDDCLGNLKDRYGAEAFGM